MIRNNLSRSKYKKRLLVVLDINSKDDKYTIDKPLNILPTTKKRK